MKLIGMCFLKQNCVSVFDKKRVICRKVNYSAVNDKSEKTHDYEIFSHNGYCPITQRIEDEIHVQLGINNLALNANICS
jgi:hypothetical protein